MRFGEYSAAYEKQSGAAAPKAMPARKRPIASNPILGANAAAIVLVHNHPSGDASPSEGDIKVTRDLIRAGQLLRIDVLDHVILGRPTSDRPKDFVSLRELGYFAGA